MENLSRLFLADINEEFCFAQYGPFKVVMRKSDGFINATHMCKLGGKRFSHWKETKHSIDLIDAIEKEDCNAVIPAREETWIIQKVVTQKRTENDKLISGTYAHPLLIVHIACWVSAVFAIKVAVIVNSYLINEYKEELQTQKDLNGDLKNYNNLLKYEHFIDCTQMDKALEKALKRKKPKWMSSCLALSL